VLTISGGPFNGIGHQNLDKILRHQWVSCRGTPCYAHSMQYDEHFRLLKEEPGVLDTPGSCVPRDSAPGAFSPGRSYRVLLVD
jgi:hypothetical protein